jgi:hypothetical protein
MFKQLLARLTWHRAAPPSSPLAAVGAEGETERVLGCGWFDSSHDLHAGLCVQEHASPDAVAQELPLADWLQMQLAGWRAPGSDIARHTRPPPLQASSASHTMEMLR